MTTVPSPKSLGGLRELLAAKLAAGQVVRVEHTGEPSPLALARAVAVAERAGEILGRPVAVTVLGYGRAFEYRLAEGDR